MTMGKLLFEIFFLPTVRLEDKYREWIDIDLCWIKWYIGIRIRREP